jgi:hypothetical protein
MIKLLAMVQYARLSLRAALFNAAGLLLELQMWREGL